MEYLPLNGNAFDSSVSELLNLRAASASGVFMAQKKSASHRVMCLYVFLCLCPCVRFGAIMELLRGPSATGLNYQHRKTLTYFASLQELPKAPAWYYCPSAALSQVATAREK